MRLNDREILVDADYEFTFEFYDYNVQVVPSAATISIYSGSTAVVEDAVCSIDTDGTITYTFSASDNDTLDENYKLVLSYTVSGEVKQYVELFDVVRYPLKNVVSDEDLFKYISELSDNVFTYRGVTTSSTSGSTDTLTDSNLKSETKNYTGGKLEIAIDEEETLIKKIVSINSATGVLTFSPSHTSVIDTDTHYILRSSYQDIINEAFEIVRKVLRSKAGLAAYYIDSTVAKNLTVYKAIELYCLGAIEADGDKWDIRRRNFADLYEQALSTFDAPQDLSDDGTISDYEDENRDNFNSVDVRI